MIPKEIVEFLGRATAATGGTRDNNLVPHVHRVSGWRVDPNGQSITCLITEGFAHSLISWLEENGQFALTVSEVPSHETYQFKGTYIGWRPIEHDDMATFENQRHRSVQRVCELFGFEKDAAQHFYPKPSLAVSFQVREIFVQTPGPDAGRRILPREE